MAEQIFLDKTGFSQSIPELTRSSVTACEIRDSIVTLLGQATCAWEGIGASQFANVADCIQAHLYETCRGLEQMAQFVQMAKEAAEAADEAGTR